MVPGPDTPQSDHEDAQRLASLAGMLLNTIRNGADRDVDPRELGKEGDRQSNRLLRSLLLQWHPNDAILSEESGDDPRRVDSERVWIVDPLDGTREFSEPGRTDWAVHVALVRGGTPTAAAVGLPALDVVFTTLDPPVPGPPRRQHLRIVVSRSRPPAFVGPLRRALAAEILEMGSAGAKAMAVALGHADAYVHAGGQYEWDSAAPAGVAAAAGLHVSRIDGSPLEFNRSDPWLPDLLVCRSDLASRLLEAIRRCAPEGARLQEGLRLPSGEL